MRPSYALWLRNRSLHFLHNHGGPHRVGCLQLGGNRFYERLFQSGFTYLWLTRRVCSPSCIHRLQVNSTTPKLEPADGHLSYCEKAWQNAGNWTPKLFTITYHFWFLLKWHSGHLLVPVVRLLVPLGMWNNGGKHCSVVNGSTVGNSGYVLVQAPGIWLDRMTIMIMRMDKLFSNFWEIH